MGTAFALLSTILFGLAGLLTRAALESVDREQGFLLSFVSNAAVLYLVGIGWLLFGTVGTISLTAIALFVAGGISGTLIGRWANFASINHLGPSRAALYKNTQPLVTTVVAVTLLDESLVLAAFVGALAILAGIWMTSVEPLVGQEDASWGIMKQNRRWGVAFGFLSALGFSGGNLLRKVAMGLWPSPIFGAVIGVTTAFLLTSAILKRGTLKAALTTRARTGRRLFILVGLLTAGAQTAFLTSLIFTEVWIVSIIMATEPVFLVVISRTLLSGREHFTPWTLWGSLLVVSGLAVLLAS